MTPAAFSVFADARINDRDKQLRYQDKLFAALSARLMYMQGRVSEERIDPETCLSFDWDKTTPEETTEDLMKTIRDKMRGWVAKTGGEHG